MKHQRYTMSQADAPRSTAYDRGKYGRLFPWLSPQASNTEAMCMKMKLLAIHCMALKNDVNSGKPAGYTYLGQFISHDLTFDPTSINEREIDPELLNNYRTPALDLDSIYGSGPIVNPYLYQIGKGSYPTKFLLHKLEDSGQDNNKIQQFYDVPRLPSGVAVIADPRNDENLFVSQLHVAFLLLHNYFENDLSLKSTLEGHALFLEARKLLQWHYQYVILHDYLNVVLNPALVKKAMPKRGKHHAYPNLKYFDWRNEPFVPLEFSGAVFRFGHSQVRGVYQTLNGPDIRIFDKQEGTPPKMHVNWINFFHENPSNEFLRIDQKIASPLFNIPGLPGMPEINLAYQNLVRGLKLQLPSGQSIAYAMGLKDQVLDRERMRKASLTGEFPEYDLINANPEIDEFLDNTPLWYYILLEARLSGGQHLGPVGSRIVAEVIIGLIQGDKSSYLNHDPLWTPDKIQKDPTATFKMEDLLKMAGLYHGALVPPEITNSLTSPPPPPDTPSPQPPFPHPS